MIIVGMFAYYLGVLLFGYNSFNTLIDVQNRNKEYKHAIQKYQKENETLLKQYLELKLLEPPQ